MHECELCGRKTEPAYLVSIDDVELGVCSRCAKGRHVISEITDKKDTPKSAGPATRQKPEEAEIVEDYGAKIRAARERMKLPLRVLAEMLNEKETLLRRVEGQKTLPPDALVKKLEHALGIKLEENETPWQQSTNAATKTEEATLGEFVS